MLQPLLSQENLPQKKRLIRSFGRIKSRKLGALQADLYQNLLPDYEFTLAEVDQADFKQFINNPKLALEIGFGFGDFTFNFIKNNPETNLLACETHINGIAALLQKLEIVPLNNVKIFKSDARLLLEKLENNIFDQIYILFPDPWPKSKHYKRRIINTDFVNLLSTKIKPSGKLIIATDHESYRNWIMEVMVQRQDFIMENISQDNWHNFPDNWVETKYQKKAMREGRTSVYLEFIRRKYE